MQRNLNYEGLQQSKTIGDLFRWFNGSDAVLLDSTLLLPMKYDIWRQLGAVVADHHAGIAQSDGDPVDFLCNTEALDWVV